MENNFLKKVSEKNKMKISVCICSYNGENYIAEQLNSIVNQTLKVDEIILSDDKSTDKTIEIAENILKNSGIDYKILINEKNQGVTKNFENSCSHATGDIIFFSDQDDIWMVNKVERICNEFAHNENAQLVFSNAELFDENGVYKDTSWDRFGFKINDSIFKKSQLTYILGRWFVTGATMAAKKSLVNDCLPFNDKFLHDHILSFVACCHNAVFPVNEKLIKYRQHSNQVVGIIKKNSFSEKAKTRVNYDGAIESMELYRELVRQYLNDNKALEIIEDKCAFLQKRKEYKRYNRFVRFFRCVMLLPKYKLYQVSPLGSFLKDVIYK